MAFDTSQLADYSWADIAKAAKQAMLSAAIGGAELRMSDGRNIRRITPEEAQALYQFALRQINFESGDGDVALVQFGQP